MLVFFQSLPLALIPVIGTQGPCVIIIAVYLACHPHCFTSRKEGGRERTKIRSPDLRPTAPAVLQPEGSLSLVLLASLEVTGRHFHGHGLGPQPHQRDFFTLILSPKSPRLLASMASVPTAYHNSWNIDSRVSIMISKDR